MGETKMKTIRGPDPKEKGEEFISWAIKTKIEERGSIIEKLIRTKINVLFKKGEVSQSQLDRFNAA